MIPLKQFITWKNVLFGAAFALLFCAGFFAGWRFGGRWLGESNPTNPFEIREGGYRFISPLLECETAEAALAHGVLRPFQHKVDELVGERLERKKGISHISVYFRDLNNGPWFGINEDAEYSPASLLKVVIMVASLKRAETDPAFLKKKVLFGKDDADDNVHENIKPTKAAERGKSYTVDELLRFMIENSDNNAMRLVLSVLDKDLLGETYADLGLNLPETSMKLEDFMSVRMYASTFRVLFNSSYLDREMSEKALGYLNRTEFKQGLAAGVPPGIPIAHKFGERVMGRDREIKQLHDCGIVYYPGSPYLLCVMTRGNAFLYLDETIQDISRLVFEEVHREHAGS